MVEPADWVATLRERGVFDDREIVHGGLSITDMSRSHPVWRVDVGGHEPAIVKQPRTVRALEAERRILDLAETSPELGRLCAARRPDWEVEGAVVTAVAPGIPAWSAEEGLTLAGADRRAGKVLFRGLGEATAHLHRVDADALGLASEIPWILTAMDGDAPQMVWANSRCRQVLERFARAPERVSGLRWARGAWRTPALIHGDLKLDNCLVRSGGDQVQVTLVDWELAGPGDPAWDLAGILLRPFLDRALAVADAGSTAASLSSLWSDDLEAVVRNVLSAYRTVSDLPLPALVQRTLAYSGAWLFLSAVQYADSNLPFDPCRVEHTARVSIGAAGALLRPPSDFVQALVARL